MRTKVGQPRVGRQPVDNQISGGARQHGLAAVRQIAQVCGPVDGRTDVVALVAQPHLPGMHADTQPDRGQRCALQLQRTRHRVAGTRERDHEVIALALFDGRTPSWTAMMSHTVRSSRAMAAVISFGWVCHSLVEPSTSASSNVTVPVGTARSRPDRLGSTAACPHLGQFYSC